VHAFWLNLLLLQPSKRHVETIGTLNLPATPPGQTWEVKLEMTKSSGRLLPAIKALDTIFFKRVVRVIDCLYTFLTSNRQMLSVWLVAADVLLTSMRVLCASMHANQPHLVLPCDLCYCCWKDKQISPVLT
jgi:hypothetical protein